MKDKGFYFTVETTVFVIAVLFLILAEINFSDQNNFNKLILYKQADDLLKVWSREKNLNKEALASDFMEIFPGRKGNINVNSDVFEIYGFGTSELSAEIKIKSYSGDKRVKVTVYT